jgi:hypothetical protein
MPTGLAKIDVWNGALDILRDAPLTATTDTTATARWLSRNYDNLLAATLRAYPWNFALDRAELAEDATTPAFGWAKRYAMPSGWVRLLPINVDGEWEGTPIDHELEGAYILTDESAPLRVRGVDLITNPGAWDPLFAEALEARIALKMAHWLTGKASYVKVAETLYKAALSEAYRIDGMEGSPEMPEQSAVIAARYAG